MKHRLLVALVIIFPFLTFFVPANQTISAGEKSHNPNSFVSITETSNYHEFTKISNSIESEEAFGRIVPNECLTSKGMLVEETQQTGTIFISTFCTLCVLIIWTWNIFMKKRVRN